MNKKQNHHVYLKDSSLGLPGMNSPHISSYYSDFYGIKLPPVQK
jgi:hypothetical protein